MRRRATSPDGSKVERRKSTRFSVIVPVEVSWRGADDVPAKQQATARQVNLHGGLLEMDIYPEIGTRVTLTNLLSAETAEARVLATPSSREGVSQGIIVELVVASESFWGVNLQVKKTTVELQKLDKALRSEGIDLRLLKEFRDAVDYVRTTSTAVQQIRDSQLRGNDESEVGAFLTSERIRRATNILLEVITDLESGRVSGETKGVQEFFNSVEQAYNRTRVLVKRRESDRSLATRA